MAWPRIIIITGTPGAGKTTLARELSLRFGYDCLDVNAFVKDKHLSEGYDREASSFIVDTDRLNRALLPCIKKYRTPSEKIPKKIRAPVLQHQKNQSSVDQSPEDQNQNDQSLKNKCMKDRAFDSPEALYSFFAHSFCKEGSFPSSSPAGLVIDSHLAHYL
ncbi:hypothetical protein COY95_00550, partial [Candidatus Woesearchaeota archaeon CG_4_10_14_0_8_um_filter_47_5]